MCRRNRSQRVAAKRGDQIGGRLSDLQAYLLHLLQRLSSPVPTNGPGVAWRDVLALERSALRTIPKLTRLRAQRFCIDVITNRDGLIGGTGVLGPKPR